MNYNEYYEDYEEGLSSKTKGKGKNKEKSKKQNKKQNHHQHNFILDRIQVKWKVGDVESENPKHLVRCFYVCDCGTEKEENKIMTNAEIIETKKQLGDSE